MEGRAYYSFDHGSVHVVVLDSGEDKVDSHEYYNGLVAFDSYRKEQATWLEQDLRSEAARRARFRVVVSHIPPRGGKGYSVDQVRELWEPPANSGRVDLWLSGHTHRFARLDPTPGQGNGVSLPQKGKRGLPPDTRSRAGYDRHFFRVLHAENPS